MKNKTFITSLALGFALVPFFASAETATTTSVEVSIGVATPTEAQIFTACSQTSIEVRDEAIGKARTVYNLQMAAALDARKEAEKSAVALPEGETRKDAIRVAVEAYKDSVTDAQDQLTSARKEAWSGFETNTKGCRELMTGKREPSPASEQKVEASMKADTRAATPAAMMMKATQPVAATMIANTQPEQKTEMVAEVKSFREIIKAQFDSIKAFFKRDTSAEVVN